MKRKILVIDDEVAIGALLEDWLSDAGYEPRIAVSVAEAHAILGSEYLPDLALVDMTLPDGTGTQLIRDLGGNPRTSGLPLILMTAHPPLEKDVPPSLKTEDVLLKPLSMGKLLEKIDARIKSRS